MSIQKATVELAEEGQGIYCPVCSSTIIEKDKSHDISPNCKHVSFVYFELTEDFEYIIPKLGKTVAKAKELAESENKQVVDVLCEHIESGSMFCLETIEDAGFGMAVNSVFVGIDFEPNN